MHWCIGDPKWLDEPLPFASMSACGGVFGFILDKTFSQQAFTSHSTRDDTPVKPTEKEC